MNRRKVFKPAYVRAGGLVSYVTMKSLSDSGASFSGMSSLELGDSVIYCHDGLNLTEGIVCWIDGEEFRVENLAEGSAMQAQANPAYPYRTIRIPTSYPCKIYSRGREQETRLHNLSVSGAAVNNPGYLALGELITLKIGDQSFDAVTVKWIDSARAGLRFSTRLTVREVQLLSESLQAINSDRVGLENLTSPGR